MRFVIAWHFGYRMNCGRVILARRLSDLDPQRCWAARSRCNATIASPTRSDMVAASASMRSQGRQREFIALVGGAAATWPLAASARQGAMPGTSRWSFAWRRINTIRLPELTADLVGRAAAVIAAGGPPAA